MRYVASISYSVGLNRGCSEQFIPSRDLRQDDPLSPYLFLLCRKGLSMLLVEAQRFKTIKGVELGRERLFINHLFFC